ncbi:MAG: hypothetical protein DGJ47_000948 [Rickettsiaceae bacterium]
MQSFLVVIFSLLMLSSCQSNSNAYSKHKLSYNKLSREDKGNNKYKGCYKVGAKYTIKNRQYKPREVNSYSKKGIASWYGDRYGFHGNTTANCDVYNKNTLTAAHKTLQMPSLVKVTNLSNNKSLIVMINDRGPFVKNRIIDLSEKAAEILKFKDKGVAQVRVKYLPKESKKLLNILGLKNKPNSTAKKCLDNKKCTVNCYIKLFNYQHGIWVE